MVSALPSCRVYFALQQGGLTIFENRISYWRAFIQRSTVHRRTGKALPVDMEVEFNKNPLFCVMPEDFLNTSASAKKMPINTPMISNTKCGLRPKGAPPDRWITIIYFDLWAAYYVHFVYYNFCRIHKTLRVTPAMESNPTDHVWEIAELLV
jgi:hypothetical protein